MNSYWQSHPPVHLMVAEYLGIKPKPKARSKESPAKSGAGNTEQDLQEFIQAFASAGGAVG